MKTPRFFIPFCLICGLIVGAKNFGALNLQDAGEDLAAPQWVEGILQRPEQKGLQGRDLLCSERSCSAAPPWPDDDDPARWLHSLGFPDARRGQKELPQAPALVRHPEGWMILMTEASDRLEVVLQTQGGGRWAPERWEELRGLPWWGPLR
tara:strand:- start:1036 stop:1488 length:453 start_codon:yes stop_codon:yes gene_type:complete